MPAKKQETPGTVEDLKKLFSKPPKKEEESAPEEQDAPKAPNAIPEEKAQKEATPKEKTPNEKKTSAWILRQLDLPIPKDKLKTMPVWDKESNSYKDVQYVPISYLINRANEIFGVDGYDMSIEYVKDDQKFSTRRGASIKDVIVITAKVKVSVNGNHYLEEGDGIKFFVRDGIGSCVVNEDTYPAQIDRARSKAIASAIKKAFKSMGRTFGLDLEEDDSFLDDIPVDASGAPIQMKENVAPMLSFIEACIEDINSAKTMGDVMRISKEFDNAKKEWNIPKESQDRVTAVFLQKVKDMKAQSQ